MKNSTKDTLKIYWKQIARHKAQTFFVTLMTVFASAIGVIIPIYSKRFFDIAAGGGGREVIAAGLVTTLLIIFSWEFGRWLLWRVASFVNNYLQPLVIAELTIHCFSELHKHSFSYFNNNFVGSLVKRVNWFTRAFESIMDQVIWNFLPLITVLTSMIAVMFRRNTYLGLGILVWLVVFLTINWFLTNYKLKYDIQRSEAESKSSAILADTITNHQNVKLFVGYKREVKNFLNAVMNVRKIRLFTWNLDAIFDGIQGLLAMGLEMGIIYLSIRLWKDGKLTIGDFILIQSYIGMIIERTWSFGKIVRSVYGNLADAEEMTVLLNTPIEITDMPGASELVSKQGSIKFDNVGFNYNETRRVISGLNLTIPGKQKVAFVGSSGSGKTTIVKLLLRMHDLTDGSISIDDQKINEVKQASLWKNISLVPQDPILFHRSLMENIRYGKPEASDEEVIAASRLAHCHEFISSLADGYNTFVGERGIKLSGGERQRVAIARAILRNAPILILDEATSSLDSESEALIQDALNSLMKDKTVIVIAHRLSTIMRMDRIVVVDKGKIIEDGTHTELLKNENGHYSQLWKIQAGGFIAEGSGDEQEKMPTLSTV